MKKETHFHSSNLSTPEIILEHYYDEKGLLVKTQAFNSDSEHIDDHHFEYDEQDNLIRSMVTYYTGDRKGTSSESLYFYNDNNQNYRYESYKDGSLIYERTSTYTTFGELESNISISYYDSEYSTEYYVQYDTLQRVIRQTTYTDDVLNGSSYYEYFGSGLDRKFWQFVEKDSILWLEGVEYYEGDRIVLKNYLNHADGSNFVNKYIYNVFNELQRETLERNGDERIRIDNKYSGRLLMEHRRYSINFDNANDNYYLRVYEYY